jgi:hypothetical protein
VLSSFLQKTAHTRRLGSEELFNAARTVTIVAPNITQPVSKPFQVTDADLLLDLNGLGDYYNEESSVFISVLD